MLSLGGLAVVGFAVGIAEQLGWLDKVAPKGVTTVTLIMVSGVVEVHKRFPDDAFAARVAKAKQVTILNTWIPNLELHGRLASI